MTFTGSGSIRYPGWSNFNGKIRKVVIEDGITGIGNGVFYNCGQLRDIQFRGAVPQIAPNAFLGVHAKVHYPAAKGGWVSSVQQNYGGTVSWVPYGMTQLKIAQQPSETYARIGDTVTVTVVAEGDGLTYAWYVKDAATGMYVKTSSTGSAYSMQTGDDTLGRQVMCVVTDQYGNFLQSDSALILGNEI